MKRYGIIRKSIIVLNGSGDVQLCSQFLTCKELLQTVDRLVEENNAEELSVIDMTQLEQELDAALVQTRLRKVVGNEMPMFTLFLTWLSVKEMCWETVYTKQVRRTRRDARAKVPFFEGTSGNRSSGAALGPATQRIRARGYEQQCRGSESLLAHNWPKRKGPFPLWGGGGGGGRSSQERSPPRHTKALTTPTPWQQLGHLSQERSPPRHTKALTTPTLWQQLGHLPMHNVTLIGIWSLSTHCLFYSLASSDAQTQLMMEYISTLQEKKIGGVL
ncbi:hypothetical protein L1987_17252 [Smallanthus sonchifolius]|uniref:Uncharacterized protein n=1 Tax=Smallanthus sonchifolius TaxID=185202 RepID=A0ACB9IWR8_9ASTR|nr:hypothetical protein L1987_17252 [Smallanthus sonchifolius]